MLNTLRSRLYQAGFPAINFMVINSMYAVNNTRNCYGAGIPVYQEQPGETVWDVLGGDNNNFLVLDRCGRMAYQVIFPYSKLTYPYVKAAILSTYKDNPCGFCNTSAHLSDDLQNVQNRSNGELTTVPRTLNFNTSTNGPKPEAETIHIKQSDEQVYINISGLQSDILHKSGQERNGLYNQILEETPKHEQRPNYNEKDSEPKPVTLTEDEDGTVPIRIIMHDPHKHVNDAGQEVEEEYLVLQTGNPNYHGHLDQHTSEHNLDWLESDITTDPPSTDQQGSNQSNGSDQSVEVVWKKKKKSRSRNKVKMMKKNFQQGDDEVVHHKQSNHIIQDSADNGSQPRKEPDGRNALQRNNERLEDTSSMEELVNQTQRLFDWYHQQNENETSNEDVEEHSNTLKARIIEHYSRLRPWIDYDLG